MTTVYLAWGSSGHETLARHSDAGPVDVLVAFPFVKQFERVRRHYNLRNVALDSGAFSAWNSGKAVRLSEFMSCCRDFECTEMFGLDVIQDPEGTKRNLETMWAAGIDAIPCFHHGSPWAYLDWATTRAKIAISSRLPGKVPWVREVFRRVHPKRIHGFAFASRQLLAAGPFDSVDASSWCFAPSAMGQWAGYTGKQMPLRARGVKDFWVEVAEHQRRARYAAARWRIALADIRKVAPC